MRTKSKSKKKTDEKKIDAFLSGADYPDSQDDTFEFPWENPNIDKKKMRKLTVRIPEEYALKLDFLNENTIPKLIKQRFILDNLLPLIDKELKKHTQ